VREGVTLQINLAPADLRHAGETLAHQLRQWGGQVDEVVFSVESHRSAGRYGDDWERREGLQELLEGICDRHQEARVSTVDYSDEARDAIGREFFGGKRAPLKSHTGAPFHAYFHGLMAARFDHVFHLDSDMLFGGGSQTWIEEAKALLAEREDVLFCSPLSGPPTPDGEIPDRVRDRAERWGGIFHGRETGPILTHAFGDVSTRVFLVDKTQLAALGPLRLRRPGLGGTLGRKSASPTNVWKLFRARLRGTPLPASAEDTLSGGMRAAGQIRVDYLGREPGMWSLHPVAHSEDFYRELPRIIEVVEGGNMPAGQLGDYDINDSLLVS